MSLDEYESEHKPMQVDKVIDYTNKVVHGDFVEKIKDISDGSVDLILTDIPYNISRNNNLKTMKDRTGRNGLDFGEWDKDFDCSKLFPIIHKVKEDGSMIIFHSFEQVCDMLSTFHKT